jgi:hypothetical protein
MIQAKHGARKWCEYCNINIPATRQVDNIQI